MTPLFANSAIVPAKERLLIRGGGGSTINLHVRYGLIDHPKVGVILIDTGYGPRCADAPGRGWAMRSYMRVLGARLVPQGAIRQSLEKIGKNPEDVTTIIVTHFHADHVSELAEFPAARVFLDAAALAHIRATSAAGNLRHGVFAELVPPGLETQAEDIAACPEVAAPLGLGTGYDLFGDGSILAIPLPGHAQGHFGLCFPGCTPPLLYACDVSWLRAALAPDRYPGFPASMIAHDVVAARRSAARVYAFADAGGDVLTCHDPAPTAYDLE